MNKYQSVNEIFDKTNTYFEAKLALLEFLVVKLPNTDSAIKNYSNNTFFFDKEKDYLEQGFNYCLSKVKEMLKKELA